MEGEEETEQGAVPEGGAEVIVGHVKPALAPVVPAVRAVHLVDLVDLVTVQIPVLAVVLQVRAIRTMSVRVQPVLRFRVAARRLVPMMCSAAAVRQVRSSRTPSVRVQPVL